jgi:hypothetical protein
VLSSGDGAEDGALLLIILDGLAGHESGTTVAELWSWKLQIMKPHREKRLLLLLLFFY